MGVATGSKSAYRSGVQGSNGKRLDQASLIGMVWHVSGGDSWAVAQPELCRQLGQQTFLRRVVDSGHGGASLGCCAPELSLRI